MVQLFLIRKVTEIMMIWVMMKRWYSFRYISWKFCSLLIYFFVPLVGGCFLKLVEKRMFGTKAKALPHICYTEEEKKGKEGNHNRVKWQQKV